MKNSRTHLAWGVVALVFATVVGIVVANRKDSSFRARETKLRDDIARLEKRVHADNHKTAPLAPVTETRESESTGTAESAESPAPSTETASTGRAAEGRRQGGGRGGEKLSKEQILDLIKNGESDRGALWRAMRGAYELEDPAEKREVLMALLKAEDGRVQYRAFSMLLEMGGPEATTLAVDFVKSAENSWLRARAAEFLGNTGGPAALAALQEAFLTGDSRLQTAAAVALNKLGQPGPTEQLITSLAPTLQSSDGSFRENTVRDLGRLRSPSTIPYLAQMINDPNSEVRLEVIDALRDLGTTDAVNLLKQMANDPNPEVVEDAKRAIDRIENPQPENSDRRR